MRITVIIASTVFYRTFSNRTVSVNVYRHRGTSSTSLLPLSLLLSVYPLLIISSSSAQPSHYSTHHRRPIPELHLPLPSRSPSPASGVAQIADCGTHLPCPAQYRYVCMYCSLLLQVGTRLCIYTTVCRKYGLPALCPYQLDVLSCPVLSCPVPPSCSSYIVHTYILIIVFHHSMSPMAQYSPGPDFSPSEPFHHQVLFSCCFQHQHKCSFTYLAVQYSTQKTHSISRILLVPCPAPSIPSLQGSALLRTENRMGMRKSRIVRWRPHAPSRP